jgi:putative ABC transport system ATP-binding protein
MLLLKDVKKSYIEPDGSRLPILDVPHFQVAAGEQVVIQGRSGCGKTTLLHVIAGISRVDQGSIHIDGVDVTRLAEAVRDRFRARNIGYIFQTFNLLPGFSALENVMLAMTFTGIRAHRSRALDLLARVGLAHRLTHKPSMLSVGEQQRVAVARSLANRPKLLLADEPTANVDPGHQQQVVELIRETCRGENVALVLVTHAREVAEGFERVEPLEQFNQVASTS